jgi:hypothetical protein
VGPGASELVALGGIHMFMIKLTIQIEGTNPVHTKSGVTGSNPTAQEIQALLDSFGDGSAKCQAKIGLKKFLFDMKPNLLKLLGD